MELFDLAAKWNVYLYSYADDTQLYLHCKPTETGTAVTTLELCLAAIGQWISANRLKLNSDKSKTELLWTGTGTSSRLKALTSSLLAVNIGLFTVIPTDTARLLGVSADFSLLKHVSTVSARCSTSYASYDV